MRAELVRIQERCYTVLTRAYTTGRAGTAQEAAVQIIAADFGGQARSFVIGYLDATTHIEPDGTSPFMIENQRGVPVGEQWFASPRKIPLFERIRIEANEQKKTHTERMAALVHEDAKRIVVAPPPSANLGRKSMEWMNRHDEPDSRLRPDQRYRGQWDVNRRASKAWYSNPMCWIYGTITLSSLAKNAKKYDVDMHGVVKRHVELLAVLNIRLDAVRIDRQRWLLSVAKAMNHQAELKLATMEKRPQYRHRVQKVAA